jgi:hypothetical protein
MKVMNAFPGMGDPMNEEKTLKDGIKLSLLLALAVTRIDYYGCYYC